MESVHLPQAIVVEYNILIVNPYSDCQCRTQYFGNDDNNVLSIMEPLMEPSIGYAGSPGCIQCVSAVVGE